MFLLIIFLFTYFFTILFYDYFEVLNFKVLDNFNRVKYRIWGKGELSPYITSIELNDETAIKNNISIWDRTVFAKVIDVFKKSEVKTIAVDIIFPEKTTFENDNNLVKSTKEFNSIFYPVVLIDTENIFRITNTPEDKELLLKNIIYPEVKKKGNPYKANDFISTFYELSVNSKGIGHKNSFPERDGIFRRYPLFFSYRDGYIPSFIFQALCDYLDVDKNKVEIYFNDKIVLPDAKFPNKIVKDIVIPIDNHGRMLINFIGKWNDSFYHYSFDKFLKIGDDKKALFKLKNEIQDNFVIISDNTTLGLINDTGPIPLESYYPLSGLHTSVVNSIFTGRIPRMMPLWMNIITDLIFIFLILVLGLSFNRLKFSLFSVVVFVVFILSFFCIACVYLIYPFVIRIIILFVLSISFINIFFYIVENKYLNELQSRLYHADKLISLGVLSASVSHEINGPNNIIVNYSKLAENIMNSLKPVLDEYSQEKGNFSIGGYNYSDFEEIKNKIFKGINNSTKKISKFSDEFKNFSKNYGINEKPEEINLNDILISSIELLQGQIKKSTSNFVTDFDNNIPLINGISNKIEQVFVNLIQNACNALDFKNEEIKVKSVYFDSEKIIQIEIEDQGVGIDKKNIDLITDPFFTTRLEGGGTGLGLYVVKNIISEHKGNINFISKKNVGTKVIVTFPA